LAVSYQLSAFNSRRRTMLASAIRASRERKSVDRSLQDTDG
jgi:hypothetical protein